MLGEWLRALGVHGSAIPDAMDRRAALYRSRLADRRVLIVADDAGSAAQVVPLLPGTAGCAVMVTSRRRLAELAGARFLSLGPLSVADATNLLGQVAGPERVAAEPQAAADLVTACGLLPLAVRLADGQRGTAPPPDTAPRFTNLAPADGLDFRHVNGGTPERHLLEIMGSGGLFFDYDEDGWVDVFIVDGGSLVDAKVDAAARDRLYRNRGNGTFEDV